tara:strand:+ start:406 stop:1200 length:795 start_codon:yes stop_codon:yes gene_type:complete
MYKLLIQKMKVCNNNPVDYYLLINNDWISMNKVIGKNISLKWSGKVLCSCGRKMKKFYRQNFCYDCFWNSPEASPSIFKPELCTAHLDIEERDLEWEKKFQIQPHVVYLSISSGLKVGVTRKKSIEDRWIDQGAVEGIVLAETPNRYLAGKMEICLKKYLSDRTSWMKMLKGEINSVDLLEKKKEVIALLDDELTQYVVKESRVQKIIFPIENYPNKIKSITLEKQDSLFEKLVGIKGQYLIFESNHVFNVRRHSGYLVDFSIA